MARKKSWKVVSRTELLTGESAAAGEDPAASSAACEPAGEAARADPPGKPILTVVPAEDRDLELVMNSPSPSTANGSAPPVAPVVVASLAPLEERVQNLENAISRLGDHLNTMKQEAIQPAPGPNVLDAARAIVTAGRTLLPTLDAPAVPGANHSVPPGQGRGWLIREAILEFQAVYFMYVDPRYRLSWSGRVVAPVLMVMFVFSGFWLQYGTCGLGAGLNLANLGWVLNKPIDLLLCFALVKILGQEARRYRESAPDLPPHLRL